MSDYYMGVDVGTGSTRVCIIDSTGTIRGLASSPITTWNDKADYYEQSTEDIWRAICACSRQVLAESGIAPQDVKGIGFDATCSLAVLAEDTDRPVSVCGPEFVEHTRNVILWMDHRPVSQTKCINATGHDLLKYVGGTMSIEMEIPKVLWLKENMPADLFRRCKFYDLADALTHIATGKETRSYCSAVCKQGYVPVGVDGSVKGWQEGFLKEIGLEELCEDGFRRMGGVHGENGQILSAGELVGTLCEKSAAEMGLVPGINIGSGVIDAYAGWIGTVGAQVDLDDHPDNATLAAEFAHNNHSQAFRRLAAVSGTSTCHLIMSPHPVFAPGIWGPYRDVLFPNHWLSEGGQSATGSLLHHIVTTHPSYALAKATADIQDINIFTYLNSHLSLLCESTKTPSISYLARNIFLYGDLHGNRSPLSDPTMRGSIVGLNFDTSIDSLATLYYAAMEFIALQTRHIIETLGAGGHEVGSVFMAGGGMCRNEVLLGLLANATGRAVVVPEYVDKAVVVGAAMLGVKAASADGGGRTVGLWEVMRGMAKRGRVVCPEAEGGREGRLLDVKYRVYLRMGEEQRRYREMVKEEMGEWEGESE